MAEDLAVLVRQAAEDPQHLPDFEALARAGRRRRAMAWTTTLAAVVAVVALAGAVLSATVLPSSLPVIGEDPAVTLPDEPTPSEHSAASSQPEVGRMEAAAAEQCQQAADEFDDAMVVEAYASPPAALWTWWLDFTGAGSDGDRWIDPYGTDPASVCLVFADGIPAPGPPGFGRPGYQWALLVVLPDGTVRPLTASPDRPTNLPPAAAELDAGVPWEERLAWYRIEILDSGLPVLAEALPDQGMPALHPPAAPEPTIDLGAAEDAARERFPDLDGYPERRTFLADYATFGPGSATETEPETHSRLVWVVLAAPIDMTPGGLGPATPVEMIVMVIVDAHDGSILAELTV